MDSITSFFGLKKSNSSSTTTTNKNNRHEDYKRKMQDVVVVSFQDRYYDIHFRDFREGIQQATVADLKERCKTATGVTLATMKLKVSGANVKDETATLFSSGIHSGSLVILTGERFNNEQVKQTASGNPEEVGYMLRISQVMDKMNGARDKIEQFDMMVVSTLDNIDQNETKRKETEDLGIYLSELLMQSLITLDAVDCPSEFETARTNRKNAVKLCQQLMDHLDQSRATFKEFNNKATL